LDKLHYYTSQPEIVVMRKSLLGQVTEYIEFIVQGVKLAGEYFRNYGFFATLKKVKSKFFDIT